MAEVLTKTVKEAKDMISKVRHIKNGSSWLIVIIRNQKSGKKEKKNR